MQLGNRRNFFCEPLPSYLRQGAYLSERNSAPLALWNLKMRGDKATRALFDLAGLGSQPDADFIIQLSGAVQGLMLGLNAGA